MGRVEVLEGTLDIHDLAKSESDIHESVKRCMDVTDADRCENVVVELENRQIVILLRV